MKSYVDADNDLMTAEDLYHALHVGKGIQNAQVAVVAINQKETALNDTSTIPKISQYHLFELFSTYMIRWSYVGTGKGKRWDYSNVTFLPKTDIILLYSATSKYETNKASMKSKKPCLDRNINNLLFCPEIGCCDSFEKQECLQAHLLSDQHIKVETVSLVDKAKQSYVDKRKMSLSTSFNNMAASSSSMALDEGVSSKLNLNHFCEEKGWALPLRKTFQFTEKQKKLLMEIFMKGEDSGQKISLNQVHQDLRKKLTPNNM